MSVILIERTLAGTLDLIYITSVAGLGYIEKLEAAILDIPFGKATNTVSYRWHPLSLVTVTSYRPGASPVIVLVVSGGTVLHRYVNGLEPFVAMTVAVPLCSLDDCVLYVLDIKGVVGCEI